MSDPSLAAFTVSTHFSGEQVILAVRGEVDVVTAPELGAIVDAVIDPGRRSVVLDLAEVRFMDASGLRVIARGAHRLGLVGSSLTIRSPSAMVRRILDLTGLAAVVRLELEEPQPARLGPQQPAGQESEGGSAVAVETAPGALAERLRMLRAVPADDDVVDAALRLVVAVARATVGGADGVSVSLRRHGRLATVAASDQTISDMDANQYDTGEGPCVDASVEGRWFHVESLDAEDRWPAFIPRAKALGINAILSSPLRARKTSVGALNIYSRTAAAFTPPDQELAALLAAQASTILAEAGMDIADGQPGQRSAALSAREVIAQAQGVIVGREGIGAEAAYTSLRRASVRSGLPLREHAEHVVASAQRSPRPSHMPLRTPRRRSDAGRETDG